MCDVCEDGGMENVTDEDGGRMKRGMETWTPTAVTSTRVALRLLSLRGEKVQGGLPGPVL